ncbi:LPS export ABC transporter permease LptG [Klebsiella pneumoniae subsp. pneumoniae]|nr:LPS export ABC transporter permease LptG [Klebsiella pneumoniae subsp. pneumoniae]
MQAFGVLDRYIGKTIFNTIMMTLFMLVSLSGIIKFVDQLKKSGQGSYDALGAGLYTILSVPKDIQIFFPMAALLGALLGLGMLAQRSELVVIQASGFTRLQVALAVMKNRDPAGAADHGHRRVGGAAGRTDGAQLPCPADVRRLAVSTQQGLWAKDGHNFVYIERVKGNDELGGVSIYAFNPERRLQSVRYAASAKFDSENKVWRLSQVDESDLTDPKQVTGSQMVSGTWKTNLTPDKLGVVALDPDALSISGLHNYVKYLKSSGQDPGRYQLNMWSKIFQPLSVAVMMLMALSFIFGPLRSVPMGVRVVTGISFGFIFYVLDQIFGPLTLVYGIPPIIGALLPSASFFLISLWLMMRKAQRVSLKRKPLSDEGAFFSACVRPAGCPACRGRSDW